MVVVASWLVYRYLAPRSWREWAGAGLVQAFIIALYAEMYGFPLTIYALVRVFGLDRRYVSANLWSTLLGLGETWMMVAMIVGYVLLFGGVGILIAGWREVCRARRLLGFQHVEDAPRLNSLVGRAAGRGHSCLLYAAGVTGMVTCDLG
jgi:hypothetical protein